MIHIVTAAGMKRRDTYTIEEIGVPSAVLMERASLACAEAVCGLAGFEEAAGRWRGTASAPPSPGCAEVCVVCGSGNNGGDGLACARILTMRGIACDILFRGNPAHMTEETSRQYRIAKRLGIPFPEHVNLRKYTVIVDALFGIGLARDVSGSYADLIEEINASGVPVLSVDIPSGVDADTGRICGCAVKAARTVTMQLAKPGLFLYPGAAYTGQLTIADIGVADTGLPNMPEPGVADTGLPNMPDIGVADMSVNPADTSRMTETEPACMTEAGTACMRDFPDGGPQLFALEEADLAPLLPARDRAGNKGSFGKVLVAAGSKDMAGAAYLSACAALKAGAGMVKILTPECNRAVLQVLLPEALLASYGTVEEAETEWAAGEAWADVLAVGPGLGRGRAAEAIVRQALCASTKPLVLDADGLNLTAASEECKRALGGRRGPVIVTPHVGEMSRLTGQSIGEIKGDLLRAAEAFSRQYGVVTVLKDARSAIALPSGDCAINLSGNDGMATAGSGDVLSGAAAALLAQGMPAESAGPLAAFLHGLAGDSAAEAAGRRSMTARDLLEGISSVLRAADMEGR